MMASACNGKSGMGQVSDFSGVPSGRHQTNLLEIARKGQEMGQ